MTALPGTRVWLPITNTDDGPAVITELPTVMTGAGWRGTIEGCSGIVVLPMMTLDALGARETVVPDTVMAEPGSNV